MRREVTCTIAVSSALHRQGAERHRQWAPGGGDFGLASLVELELLVKVGRTASQAIVAGTRTSASILDSTRSARSPPDSQRRSSCSTQTRSRTSPTRGKIAAVSLNWRGGRSRRVAGRKWSRLGSSSGR